MGSPGAVALFEVVVVNEKLVAMSAVDQDHEKLDILGMVLPETADAPAEELPA